MKKIISEVNKNISNITNSMVYSEEIEPDRTVSRAVTIDWRDILPEPQPNNSDAVFEELKHLERLTKNRTKKQEEMVIIADKNVADIFLPYLRKHDLKFPKQMIDSLWNNVIYPVVMNLKWKYNRPRPYQLAPRYGIDLDYMETKTHKTPAYPSGHTSYGAMLAVVLSELYPEHSDSLYKLAGKVAEARELQGVHYPTDNTAAMIIASALWEDVRYDFL